MRCERPHRAGEEENANIGREGQRHRQIDWSPPALDAKGSGEVGYPIKDFYLTNAICRASPTMLECSNELLNGQTLAEAAE